MKSTGMRSKKLPQLPQFKVAAILDVLLWSQDRSFSIPAVIKNLPKVHAPVRMTLPGRTFCGSVSKKSLVLQATAALLSTRQSISNILPRICRQLLARKDFNRQHPLSPNPFLLRRALIRKPQSAKRPTNLRLADEQSRCSCCRQQLRRGLLCSDSRGVRSRPSTTQASREPVQT